MAEITPVRSPVFRMARHAGVHVGGLFLGKHFAFRHRTVTGFAGDLRVRGVRSVGEPHVIGDRVDARPRYRLTLFGKLGQLLYVRTILLDRSVATHARRLAREASLESVAADGMAIETFGSGGDVHFVVKRNRLHRRGLRQRFLNGPGRRFLCPEQHRGGAEERESNCSLHNAKATNSSLTTLVSRPPIAATTRYCLPSTS